MFDSSVLCDPRPLVRVVQMDWPMTDIWPSILFIYRANITLAVTVWAGIVTSVVYALLSLSARCVETRLDSREPPLVKPNVPLLGHVFGMARQGPKYFQATSAKTKSPIYTLKMLSRTLYVITAPDMVNIVSKNTKTISFNPFIAEVAIRMTHCSSEAREVIERNIDSRDSYVTEIHDHSIASLASGPELQRLTGSMLRQAWTQYLAPLAKVPESKVSLHSFLRDMLTVSSTTALYGPQNPFLTNAKARKEYWDYVEGINSLFINIKPHLIARKSHKARNYLARIFENYLTSDMVRHSSMLTEGRRVIAKKHGMGDSDVARMEMGNMVGILVNTVPMTFYLLCHIYSDAQLLGDLRDELEQNAIKTQPDARAQLDLSATQDNCPLLNSTFQETLRYYSKGTTGRLVREDTMLDGRVLLKKGGIIQMPSSVIHSDTAVWGDPSFHARRFLKSNSADRPMPPDVRSTTAAGAYRPWGGGSTLCPGRHFATNEIISTAALVLWRFDMSPGHHGKWVIPKPKQASLAETAFPPAHDIEVLVRKRSARDLADEFDMGF